MILSPYNVCLNGMTKATVRWCVFSFRAVQCFILFCNRNGMLQNLPSCFVMYDVRLQSFPNFHIPFNSKCSYLYYCSIPECLYFVLLLCHTLLVTLLILLSYEADKSQSCKSDNSKTIKGTFQAIINYLNGNTNR